jgi:hypothetical protein
LTTEATEATATANINAQVKTIKPKRSSLLFTGGTASRTIP